MKSKQKGNKKKREKKKNKPNKGNSKKKIFRSYKGKTYEKTTPKKAINPVPWSFVNIVLKPH